MALDLLRECTLTGPAFPEPFVRFELEKELTKADLLPKVTGEEGRALQDGLGSLSAQAAGAGSSGRSRPGPQPCPGTTGKPS